MAAKCSAGDCGQKGFETADAGTWHMCTKSWFLNTYFRGSTSEKSISVPACTDSKLWPISPILCGAVLAKCCVAGHNIRLRDVPLDVKNNQEEEQEELLAVLEDEIPLLLHMP